MTKEQLIKLSGIDASKIDYAIPQMFVKKCYDIGIDPNVIYAGWICDKETPSGFLGRPLPMSELWAMVDAKRMLAMNNAVTALEWTTKQCNKCDGNGEIASNTFDEPPTPCPKCGDIHGMIAELKELQ